MSCVPHAPFSIGLHLTDGTCRSWRDLWRALDVCMIFTCGGEFRYSPFKWTHCFLFYLFLVLCTPLPPDPGCWSAQDLSLFWPLRRLFVMQGKAFEFKSLLSDSGSWSAQNCYSHVPLVAYFTMGSHSRRCSKIVVSILNFVSCACRFQVCVLSIITNNHGHKSCPSDECHYPPALHVCPSRLQRAKQHLSNICLAAFQIPCYRQALWGVEVRNWNNEKWAFTGQYSKVNAELPSLHSAPCLNTLRLPLNRPDVNNAAYYISPTVPRAAALSWYVFYDWRQYLAFMAVTFTVYGRSVYKNILCGRVKEISKPALAQVSQFPTLFSQLCRKLRLLAIPKIKLRQIDLCWSWVSSIWLCKQCTTADYVQHPCIFAKLCLLDMCITIV